MNKPFTKVLVVYTGGTLGMFPTDRSNPASPLVPGTREDLEAYIPADALAASGISFEMVGLFETDGATSVPPVDSSDVDSKHWRFIAAQIGREYQNYDGFVVLHGTDTMAYTSSALSFMLVNLAKPVVITGSQLPISHARTDAITNFVNALNVAGYKASGLPLIPEVVICFADTIVRGSRVRKMSSSSWRGFESPNLPQIGNIGEHITISTDLVRPPADNERNPFVVRTELESNVLDFGIFPGLKPERLRAVLQDRNLKGVVLRTFGAGNAPGDPEFLKVIKDAVVDGKVVVNVTQCPEGMVEAGLYAASSGLLDAGVISGLDMTPEAALTKLMSLLANETRAETAVQMQINQRGEQSQNLFDLRYPNELTRDSDNNNGGVAVSAHPSGQFRLANLLKAVVRIPGLRVEGVSNGGAYDVKLFVNLPNAGNDTADTVPSFAMEFTGADYDGKNGVDVLADITPAIRRMVEEGRAITLTLVAGAGTKVTGWDGLYLALFTK